MSDDRVARCILVVDVVDIRRHIDTSATIHMILSVAMSMQRKSARIAAIVILIVLLLDGEVTQCWHVPCTCQWVVVLIG